MPRLPTIGGIHTHLQVTHGVQPDVVARITTKARAEEVHYRLHRSGTNWGHHHAPGGEVNPRLQDRRQELAARARRAAGSRMESPERGPI